MSRMSDVVDSVSTKLPIIPAAVNSAVELSNTVVEDITTDVRLPTNILIFVCLTTIYYLDTIVFIFHHHEFGQPN